MTGNSEGLVVAQKQTKTYVHNNSLHLGLSSLICRQIWGWFTPTSYKQYERHPQYYLSWALHSRMGFWTPFFQDQLCACMYSNFKRINHFLSKRKITLQIQQKPERTSQPFMKTTTLGSLNWSDLCIYFSQRCVLKLISTCERMITKIMVVFNSNGWHFLQLHLQQSKLTKKSSGYTCFSRNCTW